MGKSLICPQTGCSLPIRPDGLETLSEVAQQLARRSWIHQAMNSLMARQMPGERRRFCTYSRKTWAFKDNAEVRFKKALQNSFAPDLINEAGKAHIYQLSNLYLDTLNEEPPVLTYEGCPQSRWLLQRATPPQARTPPLATETHAAQIRKPPLTMNLPSFLFLGYWWISCHPPVSILNHHGHQWCYQYGENQGEMKGMLCHTSKAQV